MNLLRDMVITKIEPPVVVHSEKGRTFQMEHRPFWGLSLCTSGQITYTLNGTSYLSAPGNAVLLPDGGTYTLFGEKEGFFPLINFKCTNFTCNEILVFPLETPSHCMQDFDRLNQLFLHNENQLKIYSVFYELLSKVSASTAKTQGAFDRVGKYIAEQIHRPDLSNAELAKQLGISEVYFRKQFLSHYGITPKQYILDFRMRKAKQMLRDTPFTVASIAEACGFSSVYHFCRAFKQRTGLTPTQYTADNRIFNL